MLSHRHKCIFVRVSKVASTSILSAFENDSQESDNSYFIRKHHTIAHYNEAFPQEFESYLKFSFVRNPWDRVYSQYRYQRYNREFESANIPYREWLFKQEEAMNTRGAYLFGRNRQIYLAHLTDQLNWFEIDGENVMDFVGRYEELDAGFAEVCKRLGVKLRLPKKNISKVQEDYRAAYDDETAEMVGRWNSRDIKEFDYEF